MVLNKPRVPSLKQGANHILRLGNWSKKTPYLISLQNFNIISELRMFLPL